MFEDGEEVVIVEKVHGCLMKTTPITMADGSQKPISDVQIGDLVKTYDVNKGIYGVEKVSAQIVKSIAPELDWLELEFDNGKTIICTEDHKFLTTDGWIEAKDLTEKSIFV